MGDSFQRFGWCDGYMGVEDVNKRELPGSSCSGNAPDILTSMSEETRTKPGPGTETQRPGSVSGSDWESWYAVGFGRASRLQKNSFIFVYAEITWRNSTEVWELPGAP